jgi:hypothetical protein
MTESAATVAKRVARRVVRTLIGMREGLQSGDDSGLVNVWEEICVQVQDEESFFWEAYDHTVRSMVGGEVEGLPRPVLVALWQWLDSIGEVRDDDDAYCLDDVTEYVVREVYRMAEEWSNRRIRAYLARH